MLRVPSPLGPRAPAVAAAPPGQPGSTGRGGTHKPMAGGVGLCPQQAKDHPLSRSQARPCLAMKPQKLSPVMQVWVGDLAPHSSARLAKEERIARFLLAKEEEMERPESKNHIPSKDPPMSPSESSAIRKGKERVVKPTPVADRILAIFFQRDEEGIPQMNLGLSQGMVARLSRQASSRGGSPSHPLPPTRNSLA